MSSQEKVVHVLDQYFKGIYTGDVGALREIFHPRAQLFGEVNGQDYQKSLADYLEGVGHRRSPYELGEPFLMKTLSIDVTGPIAVAKLNCPMLGFNYVVYLTLVVTHDKWLIVGKTLTNVTPLTSD